MKYLIFFAIAANSFAIELPDKVTVLLPERYKAVSVRTHPSNQAEIIGGISNGKILILEKASVKNNWVKISLTKNFDSVHLKKTLVRSSKKYAYVSIGFLYSTSDLSNLSGTKVSTTENINMRDKAGIKSNIVKSLKKNSQLILTGKTKSVFYEAYLGSLKGWVSAKYLTDGSLEDNLKPSVDKLVGNWKACLSIEDDEIDVYNIFRNKRNNKLQYINYKLNQRTSSSSNSFQAGMLKGSEVEQKIKRKELEKLKLPNTVNPDIEELYPLILQVSRNNPIIFVPSSEKHTDLIFEPNSLGQYKTRTWNWAGKTQIHFSKVEINKRQVIIGDEKCHYNIVMTRSRRIGLYLSQDSSGNCKLAKSYQLSGQNI